MRRYAVTVEYNVLGYTRIGLNLFEMVAAVAKGLFHDALKVCIRVQPSPKAAQVHKVNRPVEAY